MGHIREQRAAKLLEDTLLDWLEEGKIPSSQELQEAYLQRQRRHGDFTRSSLRQVPVPERWSESSATQHNNVIDALDGDLSVLLNSLISITNLGISTLGEWNSRAKALQVRIEKLKARIESLILLKSDTAGFVSFIEDGFFSLENISTDTTANVDTRTGEVTLNIDTSDGEGLWEGTQIDLTQAQVTWAPIESGNIRYSTNPSGSNIKNATSDGLNTWGTEVNGVAPYKNRSASTSGKPIMGEVKIKLPESTEVSKLVLLTSDASAGDNSVIAAQYSVDGYTWENVPSQSAVQSGVGNFVWRFEKTLMNWVKLIISKASPDIERSEERIYHFGFDRIKFYSEEFLVTSEGVSLVSEMMKPTLGGSDVTFGRVSLEVCEEVPPETSLRYFLRADDGVNFTDWVQVSPLNRDIEGIPAVVDFASPTELDSEDLTTVFDSSIDNEALNIFRVDGSGSLSYRFGGPNETVANFYIEQNDNLLKDLTLLRNRGYSDAKYPTVSSDLLVADIPCGWGLEGDSIYYCVFLINNPNGATIDFGPTQATLDGSPISGIVPINAGWHTFRTDRANWAPVSSTTAPTNANELEEIDPLYPYNHKYLIEGYNYPSGWTGEEKRYLGMDEYGQYLASRIGRHDFLKREVDLDVYALDVLSGPKTIVLLKFDSSRPNHENERVRLFYTRRFDSFERIQTKAVLKGTAAKTPVLSYYRVRVK